MSAASQKARRERRKFLRLAETNDEARAALDAMKRLEALDENRSWLNWGERTKTGRLSFVHPNVQNFPRAGYAHVDAVRTYESYDAFAETFGFGSPRRARLDDAIRNREEP